MAVTQTPFAIVPKWVSTADISDRAIRLYIALVNHVDNDTRKCHPGRKRLAEACRCSESSLDRAMKELVALGAVVSTPRYDEEGDRASNDYWLPIDQPTTGGPGAGGTGGVVAGGTGGVGDDGVTRLRYELDSEELDLPASPVIDGTGTIDLHPLQGIPPEPPPPVPRAPAPERGPYAAYAVACEELGWATARDPVQLRKVKEMLTAGYTADDMIGCGQWLMADPFWGPKGVDFKLIQSQMTRYKNLRPVERPSLQQRFEQHREDPDIARIFGE